MKYKVLNRRRNRACLLRAWELGVGFANETGLGPISSTRQTWHERKFSSFYAKIELDRLITHVLNFNLSAGVFDFSYERNDSCSLVGDRVVFLFTFSC
jgi:hypothetical protein